MGGSVMSPDAVCGFAKGESVEKLSNGLVSGGDMRLDTDRRFMLGCWAEWPGDVIPNPIIEKGRTQVLEKLGEEG